MAKKQDTIVTEIRNFVKAGKLVIGTQVTLKKLRGSGLKSVFLASNCQKDVGEMLENLCSLSGTELVRLPYLNSELGTICKKSFAISVFGLEK